MVWRHGKNTQFSDLSQGAEWTKLRWSVIFCCFLTLSICFFFRRGQLSNLDKLGKIAKINTRKGLVVFRSLPFSSLCSHLQTLFCLVNPLPGFSVTVTVSPKRLRRGYRRAAPRFIASLPPSPRAKGNDVLFVFSYAGRTETPFRSGFIDGKCL